MRTETSGKEAASDHAGSGEFRSFVPQDNPVLPAQAEADGLIMETIPESGTPADTPPMEKHLPPPPTVSAPIPAAGGMKGGLKPETAKRLNAKILNTIIKAAPGLLFVSVTGGI